MLLLEGFVSRPVLDELNQVLSQTRFISGARSAGGIGTLVKNNLENDPQDPNSARATNLLMNVVQSSAEFHAYTFACRMTPIIFSRYGPGMTYGNHVDSAVHALPNMFLRTDISVTVFLCDPGEYEGGELVINIGGTERVVKGKAGDAFVYPTGVTHRVDPVRSGWRKVAVGWIQSMIGNHEQRELLYRLRTARDGMLRSHGQTVEFDLVNSVYENLVRMYSQP